MMPSAVAALALIKQKQDSQKQPIISSSSIIISVLQQLHAERTHSSSTKVCVIGDGIFKFFRLQEGAFKPLPNTLAKQREAANQMSRSICA